MKVLGTDLPNREPNRAPDACTVFYPRIYPNCKMATGASRFSRKKPHCKRTDEKDAKHT